MFKAPTLCAFFHFALQWQRAKDGPPNATRGVARPSVQAPFGYARHVGQAQDKRAQPFLRQGKQAAPLGRKRQKRRGEILRCAQDDTAKQIPACGRNSHLSHKTLRMGHPQKQWPAKEQSGVELRLRRSSRSGPPHSKKATADPPAQDAGVHTADFDSTETAALRMTL